MNQETRFTIFRTAKYANFGNIRPIWERIFPIEIEYFFEKFLSISFRIRIVSNRTTSISVEVYEYCRYLIMMNVEALACKAGANRHLWSGKLRENTNFVLLQQFYENTNCILSFRNKTWNLHCRVQFTTRDLFATRVN